MQYKLGGLFILKHVATDVPPFKAFNIYRKKKPMDEMVGTTHNHQHDPKKLFVLLDYEKEESSGWQWLKILTTSGLFGYILCYNGEELVEVTE